LEGRLDRRPLKTRGSSWAKGLAKFLAGTGLTPNQISILSMVMAAVSMISFYYSNNNKLLLICAAVFIQIRLLCNLFDGMVAVEHGKKTSTGDIYNDAPDRVADVLIILGLCLSVKDMPYALHLGWAASVIAVMTAYIRVLGKSLGTTSYFVGPMAKQHRMFLITISAIIDYVLHLTNIEFSISYISLYIIVIGGTLTCFRRLNKIIKDKEEGA
jgi:phosphatidylglycerophosphate synthase